MEDVSKISPDDELSQPGETAIVTASASGTC